jgi:hypothetical protein
VVTNDGKYTAKEYLVEVGNPASLRRIMQRKPEIKSVKLCQILEIHSQMPAHSMFLRPVQDTFELVQVGDDFLQIIYSFSSSSFSESPDGHQALFR